MQLSTESECVLWQRPFQEIDEIVAKLELALADVFGEPDVVAAMDAAKCNVPPDGR